MLQYNICIIMWSMPAQTMQQWQALPPNTPSGSQATSTLLSWLVAVAVLMMAMMEMHASPPHLSGFCFCSVGGVPLLPQKL